MNKSYLIVPAVLLAVFAVPYTGARKEMEAKHQAQMEAKAKAGEADRIRKAEIDRRATEDAKRRQDEQAAANKAKEDKKQKDYDDAMKKLKDEAHDYSTHADKLANEAADLEIQISHARTDKENLNP